MLLVIGVLIVVVVVFIIQSKNNPNSGSSNSGGSGQCQMKVTNATVLNIRSSPAANGTIVGKLDNGQTTSATKTVQNGYRQLNTDQWVSAQFVTVVSGDC
jgi:uncharacterized protein YgiM (DUF1202 family)